MINKNILIFLAVSFWCISAFAQERIDVQEDSDTNSLSQIYWDLVSLSKPCVANRDEIIENYQADKKCMCEYKTQFTEKIRNYNVILARHPGWKGKIVVMPAKSEDPTLDRGRGRVFAATIDTTRIEKIKQTLSECP